MNTSLTGASTINPLANLPNQSHETPVSALCSGYRLSSLLVHWMYSIITLNEYKKKRTNELALVVLLVLLLRS